MRRPANRLAAASAGASSASRRASSSGWEIMASRIFDMAQLSSWRDSVAVCGARERLLQVCPQVFDVFAADADTQQIIGDDAALGGIARAALERRLDASQAGGVREHPDGVDECVGASGTAAHAE